MKKNLLLVFIISILFMPFLVNAETCENDKITIESIEAKNVIGNAVENNEPMINGIGVKLDLEMSEVGDKVEYELTIKNDSNTDYKLDKKSLNIESDYIDYSFETKDKTNIVKANSSSGVLLTVQYRNEVPEALFETGSFNDNKTINIGLNDGKGLINPKTGQSLILLILSILIIGLVFLAVLRENKKIGVLVLFLGLISLPFSVYALCSINLQVDSNVSIKKVETIVVYRNNSNLVRIGNNISTLGMYFDSYEGFAKGYFLKHVIQNNVIVESDVCFNASILGGELYCLYGADSDKYGDNVDTLINSFGDEKCNDGNSNSHNYNNTGRIKCSITIPTPNSYGTMTDFTVEADNEGNVSASAINKFGTEPYCSVSANGNSLC